MVYDVIGSSRTVHKAVVPVLAVKKGEVFEAGFNPRSWGWEPDQALGQPNFPYHLTSLNSDGLP